MITSMIRNSLHKARSGSRNNQKAIAGAVSSAHQMQCQSLESTSQMNSDTTKGRCFEALMPIYCTLDAGLVMMATKLPKGFLAKVLVEMPHPDV